MRRVVVLSAVFLLVLLAGTFLLLRDCDATWCLVTRTRTVAATSNYAQCVERGFPVSDVPVRCVLPDGREFLKDGLTLYSSPSLPFVFQYPASWTKKRGRSPVIDRLSGSGAFVVVSFEEEDESEEEFIQRLIKENPVFGESPSIVHAPIFPGRQATIVVPWPAPKNGSGAAIALFPLSSKNMLPIRYVQLEASSEEVLTTILRSLAPLPVISNHASPILRSVFKP